MRVCVRERAKERKRERERKREKEIERERERERGEVGGMRKREESERENRGSEWARE